MFLEPIDNAHHTSRLLKAALIVVVFLAGFLFGQQRYNDVAQKLVASEYERNTLDRQNSEMSSEIASLVEERYADEETILNLQAAITDTRVERAKDLEELGLYRNLSRGGENITGLALDSVEVERVGGPHYRLALTVIQPRGRKRVNGILAATLVGETAAGEAQEWPIEDMLMDAELARGTFPDFDFRYFQQFELDLALPEDFEPQQIKITATPENPYRPTLKTVTGSYPWPGQAGLKLVDSSN